MVGTAGTLQVGHVRQQRGSGAVTRAMTRGYLKLPVANLTRNMDVIFLERVVRTTMALLRHVLVSSSCSASVSCARCPKHIQGGECAGPASDTSKHCLLGSPCAHRNVTRLHRAYLSMLHNYFLCTPPPSRPSWGRCAAERRRFCSGRGDGRGRAGYAALCAPVTSKLRARNAWLTFARDENLRTLPYVAETRKTDFLNP